MKGVWGEERDIANTSTLAEMAQESGHDGDKLLKEASDPKWAALRQAQSDAAVERGVFGAPSYCVEEQIYWGQDRLNFVQRHLDRIS